jgi:eukaryotic-like serine/threonine-protein kinase
VSAVEKGVDVSGPHQDPFGQNPFGADPFGGAPFGQGPPPAGPPAFGPPVFGPPVFGAAPSGGAPQVNTFAILSVVLAFVFAPAGAVLAHLGLSQIRRTGQPGRRVAIIGLVLSYSVIVVIVVALTAWLGTGPRDGAPATTTAQAPTPPPQSSVAPASPPPAPTVAPADLASLLPSVEEMKNLTADPTVKLVNSRTALAPLAGSLDRQQCWSTFSLGDSRGYDAGAVRGFQSTSYDEPHPNIGGGLFVADQAVVAHADAAAAQSALQRLLADWRACGGTTVNYNRSGINVPLGLSAPSDADSGITTLTVDWGKFNMMFFARAIAAKANVVVEVSVSGRPAPTSQAVSIANAILNKIP